ncbi:hypothetical protein [Beijerinckia indica]|nr:hypothetical protein [Beijerinckia indica]
MSIGFEISIHMRFEGLKMAEKEKTERRVYVLPAELVERIRKYQAENNISSEVEAVRRLLDTALYMRDTVTTIMDKVIDRLMSDRDLRIIARDVLSMHPLVSNISLDDGQLIFRLQNGESGMVDHSYNTYIGDCNDNYSRYPPKRLMNQNRSGVVIDDIPF